MAKALELADNGALTIDGTVIGEWDEDDSRLVLDLGWMRLAGVGVSVLGDARHDKRRIILERPKDKKRALRGGVQEQLEV